jgi:hypothetical protein
MLNLSRSRLRWAIVGTGLLLLLGLRLAPVLPPSFVVPVSLVWVLLLGFLALAGHRILATWLGPAGAAVAVAGMAAVPIVLTAIQPGGRLGVRLPCPKDWTSPGNWFLLRSSPMGSVRVMVEGHPVRICYGRPAARGRTMIGGPRVPFGRLWRTGANEPTTITSAHPLSVAGIPMGPGRASLYSIPGPESWEVILNRSTSQWGAESEYEGVRNQELGRAIVASERTAEFVERFVIRPDPDGVVLEWENTRVRLALSLGGMR